MIHNYNDLLNETLQNITDVSKTTSEKIKVTKEFLEDIRVNKIINFFLTNQDRIRKFYCDIENLKEMRPINILSPKAVFNFFNEYINGMLKYFESNTTNSNIEQIRVKSDEFINKIFTKDENQTSEDVKEKIDSLNDYIWFHNIGVHTLGDALEKFESSQFKNNSEFADLLTTSISNFCIKFLNLCENNFYEMERVVKPI